MVPFAGDNPEDPRAPSQILSHLTILLKAYQDDPKDAGLHFAAPGFPGRHITVDKTGTALGVAISPGFPRSCVTPEPPSELPWLQQRGYEKREGVWSRSSLRHQEAAGEILDIFQFAWEGGSNETPTLLTASRQVLEASQALGQLTLAAPGIPATSPDFPTPTQGALDIVLSGTWLYFGESPVGGFKFWLPTLCPENLELYFRLTFGTASGRSCMGLAQGGFYHFGWIFAVRDGNPELSSLFPDRDESTDPNVALYLRPEYYSWQDQRWIPLLLNPDIQLYSYPGAAEPIYSDLVTFLPPTFTASGQFFINPANPLSLSSKWAPFLRNGLYGNSQHDRPVEPYSLALQAPELLQDHR